MEELSPFHHVMPALHRADQRLWVLFTALSCYLQSLVLGLCFADFLQSPFGNSTPHPPPPAPAPHLIPRPFLCILYALGLQLNHHLPVSSARINLLSL